MSPEWAAVIIAVTGIVGTAFNVWLTSRIRSDINALKVWAMTVFVPKADMPTYLAPYNILRELTQLRESEARIFRREN